MGVLVLIIAIVLGIFGFLQARKGNRVLAAPFRKTGELGANPTSPDPKGAISTEGKVIAPAEPLRSPCSDTPCLYYAVTVTRHYEKDEQTQDGVKTSTGTSPVTVMTKGAQFQLDDGSGAVTVDLSKGGDFDNLKKSFNNTVKIGLKIPGELVFGSLRLQTPSLPSGERTTSFEASEQVVPAEGNLFVLGAVKDNAISKPSWRSLMVSSKGREGLLGATAKKKKIGYIGGAVALVLSIPLMIFGGGSSGGDHYFCGTTLINSVKSCHANVSTEDTYTWNVTDSESYKVVVTPATGKKYAFWPDLKITDATGKVVAQNTGSVGTPAEIDSKMPVGTYTISVKPKDNPVSGGFDYSFAILGPKAPAAAVAAKAGTTPEAKSAPGANVVPAMAKPAAKPAGAKH